MDKHEEVVAWQPPPPQKKETLPCCLFIVSPPLIYAFVFRCCQQTQRSRGRCTVQPRIAREGVSALWWHPSSPCAHEMPVPNN